jgi:UDP-N-acetylmuramoyl-L-alanyl-D-glutamate--2,6-diaminopimelate ligase
MRLGQLLDGVQVVKLYQAAYGRHPITQDITIHALRYDSRRVGQGDCFIALRGSGADGHRFIEDAVGRGAVAVVVEHESAFPDSLALHHGVTKIVVADSRRALALMAANLYSHPSSTLTMVGVTGTNGKTTTAYLIRSILEQSGDVAGLIGTIEYVFGTQSTPASHTTPESLELQELLTEMVTAGCTAVSMEVSSHALDQSRVHGINFAAGVFTNLTQDHLDYHGSMEKYFDAKKILFDGLQETAPAVVNIDDPWGRTLAQTHRGALVTYGFGSDATVAITDVAVMLEGTAMTLTVGGAAHRVRSPLVGQFNVYNIAAAFSAGHALGIAPQHLANGIAGVPAVRGRFEQRRSAKGWTAIIDYAHTPDALTNCLRTIREMLPREGAGKVITVFGAGGDRDRTKRPLMGAAAATFSDHVILTSDNPRSEDPLAIIKEIAAGIPSACPVTIEPDRRKAITLALTEAAPGDVILVAGKGHEDYQVIKNERTHFSDHEVVEGLL